MKTDYQIIKVAYMPVFTDSVITTIKQDVTPSMVTEAQEYDDTYQYQLDQVKSIVEDYGSVRDVEIYEELVKDGVSYIEI